MIFVYEIPMVLVLMVVLGILGLFGEAVSTLPMKAAVIDAIIEVGLLGYVVKRHIEDKQRSQSKGKWFLAYILTIVRAAITSAATYFVCKVPADLFENSKSGLWGAFSTFYGSITYVLSVGFIYVICLLGVWIYIAGSWSENWARRKSKIGSTLEVTVISLIVSVALLLAAIFLAPALFS